MTAVTMVECCVCGRKLRGIPNATGTWRVASHLTPDGHRCSGVQFAHMPAARRAPGDAEPHAVPAS